MCATSTDSLSFTAAIHFVVEVQRMRVRRFDKLFFASINEQFRVSLDLSYLPSFISTMITILVVAGVVAAFAHTCSAAVKEQLGSAFNQRLEGAFLQPLVVEFWDVLFTYGRTLYILCAMCIGFLCARFGMGPVDLPIYIVGVLCHEKYGWVILVRVADIQKQ
jgi:fructose-specific phosphotransferase system IIC component